MCGGTNLSLRRYCPLWEWAEEADATHTDLLNPTSGRDASHPQLISMSSQVRCTHQRFVPPTKERLFVWSTWWVYPTCELILISCEWEVSLLDMGLRKFMLVASASLAHSESEQYLIGERFVPPTKSRGIGLLGPFWKRTIPDWGKIHSSHKKSSFCGRNECFPN